MTKQWTKPSIKMSKEKSISICLINTFYTKTQISY